MRASGSDGLTHFWFEPYLLALAVHSRQIFPGRSLDAGLPRQPGEKFVVAGAVVAPHDRAQGRIGFQRGGIHAHPAAFQQISIRQHAQHPQEHLAVRLHIDQPPGPRDGRMIGGLLVQADAEELAQRQRVGGAPGDPTRSESSPSK